MSNGSLSMIFLNVSKMNQYVKCKDMSRRGEQLDVKLFFPCFPAFFDLLILLVNRDSYYPDKWAHFFKMA